MGEVAFLTGSPLPRERGMQAGTADGGYVSHSWLS